MITTLTIGMPSYKNPTEVWFTISALKMYQDLEDTEILVIDNAGDARVRKVSKGANVRYERYTERVGASPAKDAVFHHAKGEFVLCLDSHILFWPGAIKKLKDWYKGNPEDGKNLIHGPMVYNNQRKFSWQWINKWRGGMWGVWDKAHEEPPEEIIEVEMAACGLIGCRKDSWLGFAPECKGFGGEAGVIHEKYRRAGRKAMVLPFLIWAHNFHREKIYYPLKQDDVIWNYLYGFNEIGLDIQPIVDHFGSAKVEEIQNGMPK